MPDGTDLAAEENRRLLSRVRRLEEDPAVLQERYAFALQRTPFGRLKLLREPSGRVRYLSDDEEAALMKQLSAEADRNLLTDLKSGYLLGAHPRKQFIAQFAGIFVGTLATVGAFRLLVPDASVLGSDEFPAPAAQTWRAVAVALSGGLADLGAVKLWSIAIGAIVGVVLTVLARIFPDRQHLIPSPAGVGLAWTFHWYYGLLFFLGGALGWWVEKRHPAWAAEFTFPMASGWIAGECLMGVLLVGWEHGPELIRRLMRPGS